MCHTVHVQYVVPLNLLLHVILPINEQHRDKKNERSVTNHQYMSISHINSQIWQFIWSDQPPTT